MADKSFSGGSLIDVCMALKDNIARSINVADVCVVSKVDQISCSCYLLSNPNVKIVAAIVPETDIQAGDLVIVVYTNFPFASNLKRKQNNTSLIDLTENTKILHSLSYGIVACNLSRQGGGIDPSTIFEIEYWHRSAPGDPAEEYRTMRVHAKDCVMVSGENGSYPVLVWPGSSFDGFVDADNVTHTMYDIASNTIPMRDSKGRVKTFEPDSNGSNSVAVNLGYLRTNYPKIPNKFTDDRILFIPSGQTSGDKATELRLSESLTQGSASVPRRNKDTQTIKVGDGISPDDAASIRQIQADFVTDFNGRTYGLSQQNIAAGYDSMTIKLTSTKQHRSVTTLYLSKINSSKMNFDVTIPVTLVSSNYIFFDITFPTGMAPSDVVFIDGGLSGKIMGGGLGNAVRIQYTASSSMTSQSIHFKVIGKDRILYIFSV